MTRLWIGVGLLIALLIGGIVLNTLTVPFHEELSQDLSQAAVLATEGRWEQAQALALQARQQWLRRQNCYAAVTDHEPMEQMEALFQELTILDASRAVDFGCVCVHLAQTAQAIGETQSLKWWNIL